MMTCCRVPTLRLSRRLEIVCCRARDRLIAEASDAIEFGLVEPVEQHLEIGIGLARETYDECRANGELRTNLAPAPDAFERLLLGRRPPHPLQHVRTCMLKRHV